MATTKKVKFYSVGASDCHIYGKVAELIGTSQGYLSIAAHSQRHAAEIVYKAPGISGITAREFRVDTMPNADLVDNGFLVNAGDLIVEDLRHEKVVKVEDHTARLIGVRRHDRNTGVKTFLIERKVSLADIQSLEYVLERLNEPGQTLLDSMLVPSLKTWLQAALDDLTAFAMVPPGEELRRTTSSAVEFADRLTIVSSKSQS